MRWRDQRRSENVEDRRGESAGWRGRSPFGGGGFGIPIGRGGGGIGRGGLGIGGIVLLLVVMFASGFNPFGGDAPESRAAERQTAGRGASQDELADFVSVVLATTEDVWRERFAAMGRRYEVPKLVLFDDAVESACGFADAAIGPFYCPADQRLYIDLTFLADLGARFAAPGDFAQAYVVAHEVGHHVQNLLGTSSRVQGQRARAGERAGNDLSVRLELQADYFAGVWAHHAQRRGLVEIGDVEEALGAAAAVGDDRLQRQARGRVVPDSFTHGTSAQRAKWFRLGFDSGDPFAHDPFQVEKP